MRACHSTWKTVVVIAALAVSSAAIGCRTDPGAGGFARTNWFGRNKNKPPASSLAAQQPAINMGTPSSSAVPSAVSTAALGSNTRQGYPNTATSYDTPAQYPTTATPTATYPASSTLTGGALGGQTDPYNAGPPAGYPSTGSPIGVTNPTNITPQQGPYASGGPPVSGAGQGGYNYSRPDRQAGGSSSRFGQTSSNAHGGSIQAAGGYQDKASQFGSGSRYENERIGSLPSRSAARGYDYGTTAPSGGYDHRSSATGPYGTGGNSRFSGGGYDRNSSYSDPKSNNWQQYPKDGIQDTPQDGSRSSTPWNDSRNESSTNKYGSSSYNDGDRADTYRDGGYRSSSPGNRFADQPRRDTRQAAASSPYQQTSANAPYDSRSSQSNYQQYNRAEDSSSYGSRAQSTVPRAWRPGSTRGDFQEQFNSNDSSGANQRIPSSYDRVPPAESNNSGYGTARGTLG